MLCQLNAQVACQRDAASNAVLLLTPSRSALGPGTAAGALLAPISAGAQHQPASCCVLLPCCPHPWGRLHIPAGSLLPIAVALNHRRQRPPAPAGNHRAPDLTQGCCHARPPRLMTPPRQVGPRHRNLPLPRFPGKLHHCDLYREICPQVWALHH